MKATTDSRLTYAKELQHIVVVGDNHGKWGELGYRIRERYKIRDSVICIAGDIGMGFEKTGFYLDEFKKLNRILENTNNVLFMVRGNHDDPSYFQGDKAPLVDMFSRIKLVPDYFLLETGPANILFVGGATSIDRTQRVEGSSYWSNEQCVYDPIAIANLTDKVTVVVTHTAPKFADPTTKTGIMGWFNEDWRLIDECEKERHNMTMIYDHLKKNDHEIKYWCYGHFHFSKRVQHDTTTFIVCDEQEFYELRFE
ncbi:MAG: metallophosphoesterase [Candidatus Pacearchaeota archaeon]|jgi:DNA repair exonuclease SbcCD nuclease subunit|nr:metallophosphoesterase [Clostridia bacterium]